MGVNLSKLTGFKGTCAFQHKFSLILFKIRGNSIIYATSKKSNKYNYKLGKYVGKTRRFCPNER